MVRASIVLGAAAAFLAAQHIECFGLQTEPETAEDLPKELIIADELERIADDEHGNLRGDKHHHSLAAMASAEVDAVAAMASAEVDADALDGQGNITGVKDLFPNANGLVSKALDDMPEDLTNLAAQQSEQGQRSVAIQGTEQQASTNMHTGAQLRQQIKKLEMQVAAAEKVLKKLEAQRQHIEDDHQGVTTRLQNLVAPRVALQQRRLDRQKQALGKVKEEEVSWENSFSKHKASALELLKERKQSALDLKAAEEAEKQAEVNTEKARLHFQATREKTSQEVEAVKYAKIKFEAKHSEVQDSQEEEKEAEHSLDRIQSILGYETQRLKKALDVSKTTVEKKFVKAQARKEQSSHALVQALEEYHAWEEEQKQQTVKAENLKEEFAAKQRNFDSTRLNIINHAERNVGKDAVQNSHFDAGDWAWSGGTEDLDDVPDN